MSDLDFILTNLDTLPVEVIQNIAVKLDIEDVIHLCKTNKQLNFVLCQSPEFWKLKIPIDFGQETITRLAKEESREPLTAQRLMKIWKNFNDLRLIELHKQKVRDMMDQMRRPKPKVISQAEAQRAFDSYWNKRHTKTSNVRKSTSQALAQRHRVNLLSQRKSNQNQKGGYPVNEELTHLMREVAEDIIDNNENPASAIAIISDFIQQVLNNISSTSEITDENLMWQLINYVRDHFLNIYMELMRENGIMADQAQARQISDEVYSALLEDLGIWLD